MAGGIRVTGLNEVLRSLRNLGIGLDELRPAFQKIAEKGAELARGFAPKVTGRLAGSTRGNRAVRRATVTSGRGGSVPYAGPVNYGWNGRSGSRYMQRVDPPLEEYALRTLEEELNRAITQSGLT